MEIVNTGDLQRIKYERTEDVEAIKLFSGIYGVGACIVAASPSAAMTEWMLCRRECGV